MHSGKGVAFPASKGMSVADSDYGQNGNGSPVEGLLRFISMLQEACGLTQEQMEVMTYHNPAWLLGLETR